MSLSFQIFSRVLLLFAAGLCSPAWSQDAAPAGPQQVRFETTLGAFTVEVDPARAPLTAMSFLQYVRDQHYDGTIFHRVIGNFVIQGGGYLPDGAEKPVRSGVPNESGNGLSNRRGTVALARTGDPHSGTSQFYVNVTDNIALDPSPTRWGYAVFGRVVEGMDVVERIASVATGSSGAFPEDAPLQPVVITTARVVGEAATPQ
jgi:cyclophilin family peptidyl-prolyl cis-trans isomerase